MIFVYNKYVNNKMIFVFEYISIFQNNHMLNKAKDNVKRISVKTNYKTKKKSNSIKNDRIIGGIVSGQIMNGGLYSY